MSITSISGGPFFGNAQSWPAGGFKPTWWDVSLEPSIQYRQKDPTSVFNLTVKDIIYSRADGGILVSDFYWQETRPPFSSNTDVITSSSQNSSIVSVDPADPGIFRHVSAGTTVIQRSSSVRTVSATVTTSSKPSEPTDTFVGYTLDCLRNHMHVSINSLLIGRNPATDMKFWLVQDHVNLNYIKNTSCWVSSIDLTCLSPYNTSTGASLGATLFTPLHVMQCRHAPLSVGAVINFVGSDGVVYQRTLVSNTTIGAAYPTLTCDLVVGRLDAPLPSSVKPALLVPSNWANFIPSFFNVSGTYPKTFFRFPGFVFDRTEEAICKDYIGVNDTTVPIENYQIGYLKSLDPVRSSFDKQLSSGDSGNPCFWLINNQAVLVTVHTGPGGGTFISKFLTEIDSVTQSHGYTASRVDLSSFAFYP